MAGALHDGVDFGVANQVILGRPLKPFGPILDARRQAVVAGRADASIIRDNDRADPTRWILAPCGNLIGKQHESPVPSGLSIGRWHGSGNGTPRTASQDRMI